MRAMGVGWERRMPSTPQYQWESNHSENCRFQTKMKKKKRILEIYSKSFKIKK